MLNDRKCSFLPTSCCACEELIPAYVISPSLVARLAMDDTESSSRERSISKAVSMVARLLTSRTDLVALVAHLA